MHGELPNKISKKTLLLYLMALIFIHSANKLKYSAWYAHTALDSWEWCKNEKGVVPAVKEFTA